jgi:pyroglutamyl-peptidase
MIKRLLITAFEPFDGEKINPSMEAALFVSRLKFRGARIIALKLPVDRHRAIDVALADLRRLCPDAMIMLGEAGERFFINPERIAINCDDFRIPDNAGNQPVDELIVERGPAAYFSALPLRAIVNRLIESNIPAAISNSAGTYLCNRLFYSVMHCIADEGLPTRAGFIHLPRLHEQVTGKRGNNPSLSRETIFEGVRLSVEVTLASLRR